VTPELCLLNMGGKEALLGTLAHVPIGRHHCMEGCQHIAEHTQLEIMLLHTSHGQRVDRMAPG
jgi:hypothetical protein